MTLQVLYYFAESQLQSQRCCCCCLKGRKQLLAGGKLNNPFAHVSLRVTNILKREMQLFLVGYIVLEICEIFTVGEFPLNPTVRIVSSELLNLYLA